MVSSAELEARLIGAGYAARHVPTETLEDLDRALADPGDLVVVAGGDGTVRATVARLAGRGIPLAILPMGTANNIGGALGLMGNPTELLGGLAEPQRKTYDLGWVRGPWGEDFFLEAAGWGLFAATMAVYDPEAGKSPFRALTAFVQALSSFQPQPLRVAIDGEELDEPVLLLEVMNTPALGPRLRLAPEASPCDGWLDAVLIREDGRVGLTRYLTGLLQNRLEELPNVTVHRCKRLRLEWDGSPFHLDAEIRTSELPATLELEIRPAALELWLPPGVQLPGETPTTEAQTGQTSPGSAQPSGATPQTA